MSTYVFRCLLFPARNIPRLRLILYIAWLAGQTLERAPAAGDFSADILKLFTDCMCINGSAFLQKKHVEDLSGDSEKRPVQVTVEDEQVDIMTLDRNLIVRLSHFIFFFCVSNTLVLFSSFLHDSVWLVIRRRVR